MSQQQSDLRTLTQLQKRLSELGKGSRETIMLREANEKFDKSDGKAADITTLNDEEAAAFAVGEQEGREINRLRTSIRQLSQNGRATFAPISRSSTLGSIVDKEEEPQCSVEEDDQEEQEDSCEEEEEEQEDSSEEDA